MATRVSPRSNASSASSSSKSSSYRAHRNPSFGRNRDNVNSDPWVPDGRSANTAKLQQQQQQQQQHTRAQWGQKPHQAGRGWSDSCTPVATKESESRSSWRSQKQAVGSFSNNMDGERLKGIDPVERTYGALPFPPQGPAAAHTLKGQWNCANSREESFYGHQSAPQPSWERHQSRFTKQNQHVPEKLAHGNIYSNPNHNQGYPPVKNTHENYGFSESNLNQTPEIRRTATSYQFDYPVNSNRGNVSKPRQGSRYSAGSSVFESGGGAAVRSAQGGRREWENPSASNTRGLAAKSDNFQALIIRDGTRQRNSEAASNIGSTTNIHWEGMGAITGSWADECCDGGPQSYAVGAHQSIESSHRAQWGNPDAAIRRRPNDSNDSHSIIATGVANRDRWRQDSQQGSNIEVATGTSIHSPNTSSRSKEGPYVKQKEASRTSLLAHRQGSFKHSTSMASDRIGGEADNLPKDRVRSQKEPSFGQGDMEVVTPKNQASPSQVDIELSEDVTLPFIMGTCEDMCPLKEREQRERLRDLAVFERVNRNPSKTSKELAVKKFCRTFTGVKLLTDDVRPLRVLWSTLQYLLNLLDDTEISFDIVHNFLFDRTRAIRQELGMQRIANSQAINMYEEIVRFHILSEHELNQRGSGRHASDSHLNLQQLSKSLLSLFELYRLNGNEKLANEAEFRAYYVLLNLDSNKNHQADSLSVWFRQCPAVLLKSWELKFARAVLRCYCVGNYRAFFQLAQEATFLQSCLMEIHFNQVRLQSLSAMNQGGYKLHPIPLADIAKQLLMKEGDLEELCNLCSLAVGMDSSKVRSLFVKQSQFSAPKELPSYRCPCIKSKQPASYFEEVTGTRQRL